MSFHLLISNYGEKMINMNNTMLLNTKEAQNYLNVSIHQIYKLTSNRLISFVKLGNRCYFKKEHLEEYIQRNIVEAL